MTPEQLATDLKSLLLQKDFRPVQQPEDTPVFDLYIRIENPVCCVLAVQPHRHCQPADPGPAAGPRSVHQRGLLRWEPPEAGGRR